MSEEEDSSLRDHFPIFSHHPDLIYLDSAATTQKPRQVIQCITGFYERECAPVHRSLYPLAIEASEHYEAVRDQLVQFFGVESREEILFTSGTTEGLNLLALSLEESFHPGEEILLTQLEHHANLVPWQRLAQRRGAVLKFIPITDEGELDFASYLALLSEKSRLVSVPHISHITGTLYPIEEMVAAAHDAGALFILDGAQSAAHLPIDLRRLGVDFFVCSAHKMYGPMGVGLLYGKRHLLETLPPHRLGGNMIDRVEWEESRWAPLPMKFEAGTPPASAVLGWGAALSFLKQVGWEEILRRETELITYISKQQKRFSALRFLGKAKKRAAIFSFTASPLHPLDVGTLLGVQGVALRTGHLCSQTGMQRFSTEEGALRFSCGLYNEVEECERFFILLEEVLHQLHKM